MHAHWLLLLVLVHIVRLLLLVEAGELLKLLLLVHILKGWLHSVLAETIHLIWPEVIHHATMLLITLVPHLELYR